MLVSTSRLDGAHDNRFDRLVELHAGRLQVTELSAKRERQRSYFAAGVGDAQLSGRGL
jgi:hypothetical protein